MEFFNLKSIGVNLRIFKGVVMLDTSPTVTNLNGGERYGGET